MQKIQKYAVENELLMFIFHGLAVDKLQWDIILTAAEHKMPSECLDNLRNNSKIKFNLEGFPENLEIDCMTIDPKMELSCGRSKVAVFKVKRRKVSKKSSWPTNS